MKHKIWFDQEAGVLRERLIGGFTEADVPGYLNLMRHLYSHRTHPRILVDLTQTSQPFYDRKTRNLLIQGSSKLPYKEKVAFYGSSPDIRMHIRVLAEGMKHQGKEMDYRFFDTEEEALNWLNQNKKIAVTG